jgi:hypothetical protein
VVLRRGATAPSWVRKDGCGHARIVLEGILVAHGRVDGMVERRDLFSRTGDSPFRDDTKGGRDIGRGSGRRGGAEVVT